MRIYNGIQLQMVYSDKNGYGNHANTIPPLKLNNAFKLDNDDWRTGAGSKWNTKMAGDSVKEV